jgi:hypothetical protein
MDDPKKLDAACPGTGKPVLIAWLKGLWMKPGSTETLPQLHHALLDPRELAECAEENR